MAQHVEPMDIDSSVCDFDDKENAFHHNNAFPRTPCTEKGYEELDVSELNMKLRYSVTPAASPMSKSYAGNFENRNCECDNTLDANMTRSLNTTLTKNDNFNKSQKTLPLQTLPTDHGQVADVNRNVLQPLDATLTVDKKTIIMVSGSNDDENVSLPSSSSSMTHTPEATTPTKEIPKIDGGSPIIRGLKSVLNMFRPSQSPIPGEDDIAKLETLSPPIVNSPDTSVDNKNQSVSASTPLAGIKTKDPLVRRKSPNRDSLVFNEDLEKELEWKDDSTIIFSHEKIPIHKLFFQQSQTEHKRALDLTKSTNNELEKLNKGESLNATVEYMDVSYNDSGIMDKTATQVSDLNKSVLTNPESDSEFLDCESTFTKNESFKSQDGNELNSTEDVLSHINDIVENINANASAETLNGSNAKSANLSTASIETTKHLDVSSESLLCVTEITKDNITMSTVVVPQELQEEDQDPLQDHQNKYGRKTAMLEAVETNETISTVSVKNDLNTIHMINLDSEVLKSNLTVENSDVVNTPVLENVGVKSLSQIPLIVDPRVLLFNIPSDFEGDKKNEDKIEHRALNTSPADIPLPEDDDIPSLPVMNSELENISHTLDKIAEEIPKINHHESSVSSVDFMSDQRSTVSPTENSVSLVESETPVSVISKNSEPQILVSPKIKESSLNNVEDLENSKEPDNLGAVSVDKNITLPFCTDDIKVGNVLPSLEPIDITEDNNVLVCKPVINIDADMQGSNFPVSSDNQSRSENKNHSSIVEHILYKEIEGQGPIDISLVEGHADADRMQVITTGFGPKTLSNTHLKDYNVEKGNVGSDFLAETSGKINHCVSFDPVLHSNVLEATEDNTQMTASDIEFIKQEIEAIVTNAIDIVTKKTNEGIKEAQEFVKNVNKIENTTEEQHKTNANNIEQDSIKSQAELQEYGELIKHEATKDFNGLTIISRKDDANEQEISLNQLSDNKYSYTVQNTILSPIMKDDSVQNSSPVRYTQGIEIEDLEKKLKESPVEALAASNSAMKDVDLIHNDIKVPNVEKAEVAEKTKEILMNVTFLDMEKIEPVNPANEEVTVSENNSPFVLVAQESQDANEPKPAENFENTENRYSTNSKIGTMPPSSPKIVSKGYNFNFDEIDDPFATKTKIRTSPAPDSSPNHSFEVIKKPESAKKVIDNNSRLKSQPDRRRSSVNNKKMNSNFVGKSNSIAGDSSPSFNKIETTKESDINKISNDNQPLAKTNETMDFTMNRKSSASTVEPVEVIVPNNNKDTCSEQSTYFSDGTSDEANGTKLAIKIADLGDANFDPFASKSKIGQSPTQENNSNPFVTRSRICQTPPLSVNNEHAFVNNNVINSPIASLETIKTSEIPNPTDVETEKSTIIQLPSSEDKKDEIKNSDAITMNIESIQEVASKSSEKNDYLEHKESLQNVSIMTSSSSNDKENTIREINTEDEDTVEGPFLEIDDLQNDDKMSDFGCDNVDIMKFTELPPENGENPDAGELFIDAEAFEFLLNQNKANTVTDSGKESLFLKFDPLFAKRMSSDGVMAALKQVQVKQSTPLKNKNSTMPRDATFDMPHVTSNVIFDDSTSLPGPSGLNRTQELDLNNTTEESLDDLNVTVSKPMMVVNPAVNPIVTPRNKTITPVRANRQSLTFTSPAIAVIDILLSMSAGNTSQLAHDATVAEVHRDNEADLALTQLRELLADKEISVYNLRSETKELQNRLATLESQMKNLETISEDRLKKINELNEKLDEKSKINKKMAQVVEEYERTIASLIAEKELDKKRHAEERLQLIKERDEQTAHLASMEVSFSDLHSKYEKSKQIILGFKANEDAYKKSIREFEENLAKMQNNYELLKQHATSKLNHANEELQKINRAHEAEVLKMNAMIKRKELHITSLEETLQQKTKANEELTAICDELINKVG